MYKIYKNELQFVKKKSLIVIKYTILYPNVGKIINEYILISKQRSFWPSLTSCGRIRPPNLYFLYYFYLGTRIYGLLLRKNINHYAPLFTNTGRYYSNLIHFLCLFFSNIALLVVNKKILNNFSRFLEYKRPKCCIISIKLQLIY